MKVWSLAFAVCAVAATLWSAGNGAPAPLSWNRDRSSVTVSIVAIERPHPRIGTAVLTPRGGQTGVDIKLSIHTPRRLLATIYTVERGQCIGHDPPRSLPLYLLGGIEGGSLTTTVNASLSLLRRIAPGQERCLFVQRFEYPHNDRRFDAAARSRQALGPASRRPAGAAGFSNGRAQTPRLPIVWGGGSGVGSGSIPAGP